MDRTYTDIVKIVCCVLFFLHHFCLGNPWAAPLGYIACSILFFLSSYVLCKSQDRKNFRNSYNNPCLRSEVQELCANTFPFE